MQKGLSDPNDPRAGSLDQDNECPLVQHATHCYFSMLMTLSLFFRKGQKYTIFMRVASSDQMAPYNLEFS